MNSGYTDKEKFLSIEFVIKKEDLKDWLTPSLWEGIKDCFRTPIIELVNEKEHIVRESVVGFVRTLYVDPQDEFVSFEGLFWPMFSNRTKEDWNDVSITGISFYDQEDGDKKAVSCFSI